MIATRVPAMQGSDYARVERAIGYLHRHARRQPRLAEVAAEIGLSEFHFQRLFQRWAGISPKRFLQVLTLLDAKRLLAETRSLLDVSLEVGLSGPSRLHDLFLTLEKMTPGEYRERARGLVVRWGVEETPLGAALFATLDRGLCGVEFVDAGGVPRAREALRARWAEATLVEDRRAVRGHAAALRARFRGEANQPLGLVLKGTPLQLKVWEALLAIPPGRVAAYQDVAARVGAPRAVRAVGSAIARNPIAVLIPCHRVIRASGAIGEYHWGAARKLALLGAEAAHASPG